MGKNKPRLKRVTTRFGFLLHLDEFWMRKHELIKQCAKGKMIYLGDRSFGEAFFVEMRRA